MHLPYCHRCDRELNPQANRVENLNGIVNNVTADNVTLY